MAARTPKGFPRTALPESPDDRERPLERRTPLPRLRWATRTFLCLCLFLLVGCAKNPVTGKRQLALISEAQEIEIGKASHPEVLAEFGRVDSEALQSYVDGIGQRMAARSHRPDLPWTFTVVDSPVVNAFAVPGGFIYLTRGILAYMNTEAEMAGVLGHEIGHVTARHSVTQLSRAQLFGLGIGLGSAFSKTLRGLSDLAQIGTGLLFLKYGRDAERQADQLGVEYMYNLRYDPRQLSQFFEVFQSMQEASGEAVPNWLSSHPAPPDRIEATSEQARELLAGDSSNLRIGRDELLNHVDGLIFGENPREGLVVEDRFLHPDLRFQLNFPTTWQVENTKSAVYFTAPDGSAGIQLTFSKEAVAPEQRARQIAEGQGIEMVAGSSRNVAGNSSYLAEYRVLQEGGGELGVVAAFIPYRGNLYELAGIAPLAAYDSRHSLLLETLLSFRELSDRQYLNVQPDILHLYRVPRAGTLADVAARYPNPRVDLKKLQLLNRISPQTRLQAGQEVKVVEAGRR